MQTISIITNGDVRIGTKISIDGSVQENIAIQKIKLLVNPSEVSLKMEYFKKDEIKELLIGYKEIDNAKKQEIFSLENIYFELNNDLWQILINKDITKAIIKYEDKVISYIQELNIEFDCKKPYIVINMNIIALNNKEINRTITH